MPSVETTWQVPEPTVDETIQILKGLRERYEIHHKLRYTDEALVAAAQLSYQYIRCGWDYDSSVSSLNGCVSHSCVNMTWRMRRPADSCPPHRPVQ